MVCGGNNDGQLGLGDTDHRDTFTVVAGLRGVVDIDAGYYHTIAVTCEGEVWTWGMGPATGHNDEDAADDEDTLWLVPTKVTGGGIGEAKVVQVSAGAEHSMAKTATAELYSWGSGGTYGQLGHGGNDDVAVPRVVDSINGVVGMAGGVGHSLVTTVEGRLLVFGTDASGALGLGAEVEQSLTPTVIDGITMGEGGRGEGGGEGKE
jgi:alpha-tubulin suppressor-like RCC1 family protein